MPGLCLPPIYLLYCCYPLCSWHEGQGQILPIISTSALYMNVWHDFFSLGRNSGPFPKSSLSSSKDQDRVPPCVSGHFCFRVLDLKISTARTEKLAEGANYFMSPTPGDLSSKTEASRSAGYNNSLPEPGEGVELQGLDVGSVLNLPQSSLTGERHLDPEDRLSVKSAWVSRQIQATH